MSCPGEASGRWELGDSDEGIQIHNDVNGRLRSRKRARVSEMEDDVGECLVRSCLRTEAFSRP